MTRTQWFDESETTTKPSTERQRPSQVDMRAALDVCESRGPSRCLGSPAALGATSVSTVDQSPCMARRPPLRSAMSSVPPRVTMTRMGELKRASWLGPSACPASLGRPAIVVTIPLLIMRITWFPVSATIRLPRGPGQIPCCAWKRASAATPSRNPIFPQPARVETVLPEKESSWMR